MKKIFFSVSAAILLILGSFVCADNVFAEAIINSVKLNGPDNLIIKGGEQITATINVSLTNSSVWKSTAYRFGDGDWNCANTQDYSATITKEESFLIYAPIKQGTSDVNFEIYENDDCTNNLNSVSLSANLSSAVLNVLSFKTGKTWLSVVILVLIIIIASFITFYIVKKVVDGRTKIYKVD